MPAKFCAATIRFARGRAVAELHRAAAGRQARPRPRAQESCLNPLRMAVIGVGHLGRIHTRILRGLSQYSLVGVVDPVAENLDAAPQANSASPAIRRSRVTPMRSMPR